MRVMRHEVEQLFTELGFHRTGTNNEWRVSCPRCGRAGESSANGTLSVNSDKLSFVCYRCGFASSRLFSLLRDCGVDSAQLARFSTGTPQDVSYEPLAFASVRPRIGAGQRPLFPVSHDDFHCAAFRYMDQRSGGGLCSSGYVTGSLFAYPQDIVYDEAVYSITCPVRVGASTYGSISRYLYPAPFTPKYRFARDMATGRLLTCASGESVFVANTAEDKLYLYYGGDIATWAGTHRSIVVVEGYFDMVRLQVALDRLDPTRRCQVVMSYGRALSRYQLFALDRLESFDRVYICWDGYAKDPWVPAAYQRVVNQAAEHYPGLTGRLGTLVYADGDPGDEADRLAAWILKAEHHNPTWYGIQRTASADPLRTGVCGGGRRTLETYGLALLNELM